MAARSDNFNRADGSLGTPSDGGSNWVTDGNAAVGSNQAVGAVFSSSGQASYLEASNADVEVQCTLKALWNSGVGPAVRCSGTTAFIWLKCTSSGVGGGAPQIVERNGASTTVLATCSGTTSTVNDVVKLKASGTTIEAYVNGSLVGSTTSTFNQAVTKHGFAMSTGNPSRDALDDFSIADAGGGDVTAPTLSSAAGSATGGTTADLSVTTDEANGTLYAVVTTSSTAPSAAQVKAGQNHLGASAVFAGSQAISSTGSKTIGATGLTSETTYYAHFMHEDAAANQSSVASSSSFTTLDVTAPTAASWATNTNGDEITATFSESGCSPASGSGGFALSGTSAAVSSWAISGTTLTLTLSDTIYDSETVTISYDRANTTDDIKDAANNFLANFSGTSVTNNSTVPDPEIVPGTASFVSSGPGGISVEATDASGGTAPYTYQWERNEDGGSFSNVTGATSLTLDDSTATTPDVLYGYRLVYTDADLDTATSNTVTAEVYEGGAIGAGGSSSVFQSSVIRGA